MCVYRNRKPNCDWNSKNEKIPEVNQSYGSLSVKLKADRGSSGYREAVRVFHPPPPFYSIHTPTTHPHHPEVSFSSSPLTYFLSSPLFFLVYKGMY